MRKTLIFLVLYFLTSNLSAQALGPGEPIDSIFESIKSSSDDWLISLSIEQAGTIYDSLGNSTSPNPEGTFLFLKLGKNYFLQKLHFEYEENSLTRKVIIGKRVSLSNDEDFNYSVDSILLPCTESIYPFVYKNGNAEVYNVLEPSNHEPYYTMYFKTTQEDGCNIFFTETSLSETKFFMPYKNLNYPYNSKTFIYRSFLRVISIVKNNMKAL